MLKPLQHTLTPAKALIFRITHRANVRWLLRNGLCCSSANKRDSGFVSIGNPELIERRSTRVVPIPPGGTLADYLPFYFTPYSPMLYNIRTGYGGIQRRENSDIVILVSSLPRLAELGITFLFTDRHAYLEAAEFQRELSQIGIVDWPLLQTRDFSRDPEDPGKFERYQAEALVHGHLPAAALLGIACYTRDVKHEIDAAVRRVDVDLETVVRPGWYFS